MKKEKENLKMYVPFSKHPPPFPQHLMKKVNEKKIVSRESLEDIEKLTDENKVNAQTRRKRNPTNSNLPS